MKRRKIRTLRQIGKKLQYDSHLTVARKTQAISWMNGHGFFASVKPEQVTPDEIIGFMPQDDPRCALIIKVAAGEKRFSREEVQQAIGMEVESIEAMHRLAEAGVAVDAVHNGTVKLSGTNVELARMVNQSRVRTARKGFLSRSVAAAALGLALDQVRRLSADRRLAAALVLDGHAVNAESLLDAKNYTRLMSRWHINQ